MRRRATRGASRSGPEAAAERPRQATPIAGPVPLRPPCVGSERVPGLAVGPVPASLHYGESWEPRAWQPNATLEAQCLESPGPGSGRPLRGRATATAASPRGGSAPVLAAARPTRHPFPLQVPDRVSIPRIRINLTHLGGWPTHHHDSYLPGLFPDGPGPPCEKKKMRRPLSPNCHSSPFPRSTPLPGLRVQVPAVVPGGR